MIAPRAFIHAKPLLLVGSRHLCPAHGAFFPNE
nr:MAG TPA: PAAR motif protein [Caudoviricetes sp.]